jgi:hypothetical protein
LNNKTKQLPPALEIRKSESFWPKIKPGKSQGKRAFHLGLFLGFPRNASHPGWPLSAAGPEAKRRKLDIPFKQQREASCLDTPSNIRK